MSNQLVYYSYFCLPSVVVHVECTSYNGYFEFLSKA
jgi:hypothetical protein